MSALDGVGNVGLSDIVSLDGNAKGFRYEMVKWEEVILEHDLNPFSKHTPSGDFLNKGLIDKYEGVLERVGPIYPLVVFDHSAGYTYLGPLELYYAYDKVVKKLKSELYVYVAVLPRETTLKKIIEASVLLNPDENIPDQLHRLKRLKSLLELKLSLPEIKRFLKAGKSNGAFATQLGRDASICKIPVAYELTSGIKPDDGPLQLPRHLDAKISYSTALKLVDKLGDDENLWKRYKVELDLWIQKRRGYELPTDVSIPMYQRGWYKEERDKPLKIALGLLDENYMGAKSAKISVSRFKPWEIAVTDSNARVLRIPSVEIDLKKKSFDNVKLLFDIAYKMELVSQSLKSYLGLMSPIEHGGEVRGHASMDDKTIELRSNLTEFDGYNYALSLLRTKYIKYSDHHRLLKSLGVSFSAFGFKNSSDIKSIKSIRATFIKWDRENAYKFESNFKIFDDLGSILSRQVIYKKLKESIKELDASSDHEIDFESFVVAVFTRSFKMWQIEFDAGKREANSIQVGERVKKFRRKMKRKPAAKKKMSKIKVKKKKYKIKNKPLSKKRLPKGRVSSAKSSSKRTVTKRRK